MTTIDRIMEKISPEPNSGCWLWLGATTRGYGCFHAYGKTKYVHIFLFELKYGPVSKGLELDHLCRVPCCVNPQHLEIVTHCENSQRSPIMGPGPFKKTHCPQGHEYSSSNTRYYNGFRCCRECRRVRASNSRKNKATRCHG